VPDQLLDVVKEEQNRAREANRGARGGHSGSRGTWTSITSDRRINTHRYSYSGRGGMPARGTHFTLDILFAMLN